MPHLCEKSISRKKKPVLFAEKISISCTTQECSDVKTSYIVSNFRSIICSMVAHGRLKTKENFKLLALKVVAVAYKRFQI